MESEKVEQSKKKNLRFQFLPAIIKYAPLSEPYIMMSWQS